MTLKEELQNLKDENINTIKVFFDMEFTELYQDTEIISIGCYTEAGEIFYGEITNYNKDKCSDWIKENVINNLNYNGKEYFTRSYPNKVFISNIKSEVARQLREWLNSLIKTDNDEIQFISDVCHYDFVLLIDLLCKNALYLPDYISPVCIDINPMIAYTYDITDAQAFDITRENILKDNNIELKKIVKHNSLFDVMVISMIYKLLK